jgi:two-component system cell cycle response regulator
VLRLLRLMGLLAPVAVGIRLLLLPPIERALGVVFEISLVNGILSGLAGAGVTCLLLSLWVGFRLDRLARATERIAAGEHGVRLPKQRGGGVEGRLASAINVLAVQLSDTRSDATTDRLTGLANRQMLLTELMSEIERVQRYGRPLSVAFVDIDHFKTVNDTYGHHAGDVVLQAVAQVLRSHMRATDLVGRYGGEEFMLLLTETDVQEAAALAEKLRMLVMQERIAIGDEQTISVTISIGVAGGTGQQVRLDTIVRDADAAMYSAKSLGRNQTYVFEEPDEDSRVPRAPISAEGRASALEIGKQARAAAVDLLYSIVEPLPHYQGKPSELIAVVATSMARHLGLPEAEIERVRTASLLHDLGKLGVPTEILDKPAPLSSAEWQRVVQHPRIGQLILEQAGSLRDSVPIILHHHERFSGHGYPYGLRGADIPLGARIVAIADAYDAMVSDRPYKPAIGHSRAIAELRRHAGTQFDPELVTLFCDLFSAGVPGFEDRPGFLAERRPRRSRRSDIAAS